MSTPSGHSGFFRVSEEAVRKIVGAFEEPWATRAAMLAYITLCRKANLRNSGSFEDRIASMAQDMAMPYREAQRAIGLLEGINLVAVERRTMPGTSAKLPSIYHVQTLLPDAMTLLPDAITSGEDGLRSQSPHLSQEQYQEQPQEHSKAAKAASDPDFDRFWESYPRKVSKPEAIRAWRKTAKTRPPLPKLLNALAKHKARWNDPKFIPHPATWINGERWNDELADPTPPRREIRVTSDIKEVRL